MDKAKLPEELSKALDLYARGAHQGAIEGHWAARDAARVTLESLLLSQQAELEALRKVVDELIEWNGRNNRSSIDALVARDDIIARATELRAKGEVK